MNVTNTELQTVQGTILIAHGVGSQQRSETVGRFADALGKSLRSQGYRPHAEQEQIYYHAGGESFPATQVRLRDSESRFNLRLVEFHWADASSLDGSWATRFSAVWRILVGLPKLGFLAIENTAKTSRLFRLLRAVFFFCWFLIVLRLVAFSALVCTNAARKLLLNNELFVNWLQSWPTHWERNCELGIDLCLAISLVALGCLVFAIRCCKRGSKIPLAIAITSLAMSSLFTMHLPQAFHTVMIGAEESSPAVQPAESLRDLIYENLNSVTRVTGIATYLIQSLLIAAIMFAGAQYVTHVLKEKRKGEEASDHRLNRLLAAVANSFRVFTMVLLFVVPFCWLVEFFHTAVFGSHFFDHLNSHKKHLILFAEIQVALVALPLLFSGVRQIAGPIGELILDVMNYFPAVRWFQHRRALAYAMGAASLGAPHSLRSPLTKRLKGLLEQLDERADNETILVSHSLGTVIAYDTLVNWGQDDRVQQIRLITMGSPLAKLLLLFPDLFDAAPLKLRAWTNLFRVDDYVGTKLPRELTKHNQVEQRSLGVGGHLNYYDDPTLADTICTQLAIKSLT